MAHYLLKLLLRDFWTPRARRFWGVVLRPSSVGSAPCTDAMTVEQHLLCQQFGSNQFARHNQVADQSFWSCAVFGIRSDTHPGSRLACGLTRPPAILACQCPFDGLDRALARRVCWCISLLRTV